MGFFLFRSLQETEELRGGDGDQSEHQVRHHLCRTAHPHEPSAIVVLQIRVDPLGRAPVLEALCLGRIHLLLFSPPGVGINNGNMPQCCAERGYVKNLLMENLG